MEIEICEYSDDNLNDVIELILEIQQKEFGIDITIDDQPDLKKIPEFYQKGCGNFWTAICNGRAVGTIALIDIGDGVCALRKMFVKKDFRGKDKGVAKKLLERMNEWSLKKGVREIFLGTTSKYYAAHRFYEKNNFTEIKKERLPESFPVMAVDSKFYHYSFNGLKI